MWNKLLTALFAALILNLNTRAAESPRADIQPNIIFILADDFGYGDLSCYGSDIPTPHLDQMAKEGTRFTQAYVASPICSPSRAALITGQHPARWRITSFLQSRKGNRACEMADFLDPKAPSLPRILKNAGYRTAHVGKWHLGGGRDVTNAPPFKAYGYDLGLGTYESPEPHPDITGTNWIWSAHDPVKRWDRTKWMVDRTLDFLKSEPSKPAFVNLWLDDTHTPWVPSADEADQRGPARDNRPNFRRVLMEMDRQLGRLMESVRTAKSDRPTFVVFMGDNGPLPTFSQTRTAGLRGSKLSLYEGGVRVPLVAWWPNRIPAGRVDHITVVSALDFLPTFAEITGAKIPSDIKPEGQNMTRAFFGNSTDRTQPLFWEYGRNTNSFGYPRGENRSPNLAMREGKWKFLIQSDGSDAELYDLDKDAREQKNLAASNESVAMKMKNALLEWRKSVP